MVLKCRYTQKNIWIRIIVMHRFPTFNCFPLVHNPHSCKIFYETSYILESSFFSPLLLGWGIFWGNLKRFHSHRRIALHNRKSKKTVVALKGIKFLNMYLGIREKRSKVYQWVLILHHCFLWSRRIPCTKSTAWWKFSSQRFFHQISLGISPGF